MMARDSERLIVMDGSEKNNNWLVPLLTPIAVFILLSLTIYGGAIGLENKDKIDMWTSAPQNQIVILWFVIGLIGLIGVYWFGHWFMKKWKEE